MGDYSLIRDSLTAKAHELAQPGTVQPHERVIVDWNKFLEAFASAIGNQRQVRGWWVVRDRREDAYDAFSRMNRMHTFLLIGILGVQDGADTDATFGNMVDDLMNSLAGMRITGTEESVWEVAPPTLRDARPRQFGSVLCHFAEVAVVVHQTADF